MQEILFQDMLKAVGGESSVDFGQQAFEEVSTDSRTIRPGSVFFAIVGERLNGHHYVDTALEKGAAAAVVSQKGEYRGGPLIYVPDTTEALCRLARFYRSRFSPMVVAVTGSVGKTTTKEMFMRCCLLLVLP